MADAGDPLDAIGTLIYNLVLWVGQEPYVARILASDQQYLKDSTDLVDVERERQTNLLLWIDVVRSGIEARSSIGGSIPR